MSDAPSGELVFADLAFERELIKSGLDHRHAGRQLFEVDEPEAGVVRWRQEHRRRPAGAVGGVAPGDAAQIDRVEQERPDVDIFAAAVCRDLLRDHRLCRAGRPPDHSRLTGFDEKGEGRGELARAERVVRGNGCGLGHGQDSGMAGRRRGHPPGARPSDPPEPCSTHCPVAQGRGTAARRRGSRGQAVSRLAWGTAPPPARQPTWMRPAQAPEEAAGALSRSFWRSSIPEPSEDVPALVTVRDGPRAPPGIARGDLDDRPVAGAGQYRVDLGCVLLSVEN